MTYSKATGTPEPDTSPGLGDSPPVAATRTRGMTTAERFEQFHEDNPHVYALLVHYCQAKAKAGHTSFGVRAPWERMRWQLGVTTDRPDGEFALNDHYTSFYARLIVAREPDLADLLTLRASDADEWVDDYLARTERPEDGALFQLFPPADGGQR